MGNGLGGGRQTKKKLSIFSQHSNFCLIHLVSGLKPFQNRQRGVKYGQDVGATPVLSTGLNAYLCIVYCIIVFSDGLLPMF